MTRAELTEARARERQTYLALRRTLNEGRLNHIPRLEAAFREWRSAAAKVVALAVPFPEKLTDIEEP